MNGKLIISVKHGDYLSLFIFINWLAYFSEAAGPKVHEMQDVTREWGSGEINIPCFLEEHRSHGKTIKNTMIFWKKNGEDFVHSVNGIVTYQRANPNTTKLHADASLSVQNDYSAMKEYICSYSRPNESYIKSRTRVTVLEPPLRVLECNITDANQSTPCRVTVPNGTESLTFTLIKAGLRTTLDPTLTVDSPDIPVEEQTKNTTRNEDNSTTITVRYTADVIDLTLSSEIRFILTTGLTKEEYVVVLNKAEGRDGVGGVGGGNGVRTAAIIAGVLGFVVIIIVAFVIRRKHCRRRPESAPAVVLEPVSHDSDQGYES